MLNCSISKVDSKSRNGSSRTLLSPLNERLLLLKYKFDSRKYWDLRYEHNWNSGTGSYGESCESKARDFNIFMQKYNINSVIEFGCGDGNQLTYYNIPEYLGLDVSPTAIKNCSNKFQDDQTKSFMWYDPFAFNNKGNIFKADATISIEVIFHLVEDEIFEKYMQDLFSCSREYVIIFSTNFDHEEKPVDHLVCRKFTDYVDQHFSPWNLLEEFDCIGESGEVYCRWFVYKK